MQTDMQYSPLCSHVMIIVKITHKKQDVAIRAGELYFLCIVRANLK
jgi:hypothetical protein